MVRLLMLVALALTPAAAAAGVRATYVDEHGFSQTLVIADNGDIDAELRTGQHLVVRGGRAFIVEERLTGPIVTPLEELEAAAREPRAARSLPRSPEGDTALRNAEADLQALAGDIDAAEADRPRPTPALVPRENIQVNGRIGRGYYYPRFDNQGEELFVVMSDDPALASIGAVFRQTLAAEAVLQRLTWEGPSPAPDMMNPEWRGILYAGTPIQYYSLRLRDVEQVAIPSIALPAEPETGAALRARLAVEAADRHAPPAPEWMASRAIFAGGRLYLVAGNQRLLSLAEGERSLTRHDLGEPVLDVCVQGGEPLALTGAAEGARTWMLRRLHGGQWQSERTVARDNDEPVALACTPEGPYLLTSRRFIDLTQARAAALRLSGPIQALVSAAVHVTPRAVFVGLNAGEWGGGLRRIDRRSGRVETIERNATGELCDGPLNTDCDPVQGLATIPWRPDCVAAAIGLIHMMAHGRLTMVCPDRIEQLYAAADGEPSTPERARDAAQGGYGSVAFFGLAATGNGLIAIGHNGLHRLDSAGAATRMKLPRFTRVEGVLVSFALPDVVLVVTGINGRASLSGAVPIMAVRQER